MWGNRGQGIDAQHRRRMTGRVAPGDDRPGQMALPQYTFEDPAEPGPDPVIHRFGRNPCGRDRRSQRLDRRIVGTGGGIDERIAALAQSGKRSLDRTCAFALPGCRIDRLRRIDARSAQTHARPRTQSGPP